MSNTPPDNAVEQRRKVLKGALAASGVVTMGYSGPALASFECITSTSASGVFGFRKVIDDTSSNWAWLELPVYFTTTETTPNVWKAVKVPNGSNPAETTDLTTYFFDDNATSPSLALPGVSGVPDDIEAAVADGSSAYVIIYFDTEGSIVGFFPKHQQVTGVDYPAQGSCLTSLNPQLTQTNIVYGG